MTVVRRPYRTSAVRRSPWPRCRRCSGIALDLGSSRTRAWIAGRGMVLDVPTVTFPGSGAIHPIQRGAIVDTSGTARMLDRLLGHRLPRFGRPLVVVTTPVLDGPAFREAAHTAVEILRPRAVHTVPGARAVALAAGADHSRPLLVVDLGAHLTEVVLLAEGAVTDARRTALGVGDLGAYGTPPGDLTDAVVDMVTAMLRQDRGATTRTALRRGILLSGGGALRPEITHGLPGRLGCPVQPVPSPHTAAVRGAAGLLAAAHHHPLATGSG
ncbi:rod shape-determining protein [Streptomyces sp. NPDC001812]|uniref:Rod shape-determining protein n=1 Tax=Streptomyces cathayae TaxID=3031124 RepID=A0ABY8JY85_9ACTN|nr:rod shape-determining protein [Streptomyces sp. HUAS 5]WGD39278.1 rod shape-determining protein [Streptomyces sp. HUAS 5]